MSGRADASRNATIEAHRAAPGCNFSDPNCGTGPMRMDRLTKQGYGSLRGGTLIIEGHTRVKRYKLFKMINSPYNSTGRGGIGTTRVSVLHYI